jgi:hypothetical protein
MQYLRYSSCMRSSFSMVSSFARYSSDADLSVKELKFAERESLILCYTFEFWIIKHIIFAIVVA